MIKIRKDVELFDRELTGVCDTFQDESASKTQVIEEMRETVNSMERQTGGLKAQLHLSQYA